LVAALATLHALALVVSGFLEDPGPTCLKYVTDFGVCKGILAIFLKVNQRVELENPQSLGNAAIIILVNLNRVAMVRYPRCLGEG
jgi:hypothetical protein